MSQYMNCIFKSFTSVMYMSHQVINENCIEDGAVTLNPEAGEMPLLVYVSREKRPSHPHCFKAGALNALV